MLLRNVVLGMLICCVLMSYIAWSNNVVFFIWVSMGRLILELIKELTLIPLMNVLIVV
jgi:hypothetical protein